MAQGKIVKGIAGFYYIQTEESGKVYECKAKGIFRKEKLKPLVGDNVQIEVLDEVEKTGNIISIFPRSNELIRPAVANIDLALVIFAVKKPNPNLNLLDRFLVMMEEKEIETVICFNKMDLADEEEIEYLRQAYASSGYKMLFLSAKEKQGLAELKELLLNKTTAVAGPSGVGKSTLINELVSDMELEMETGSISEKIDRGKHTTRHSQLLSIDEHSYIMDTPGFSSLFIQQFEKEDVKEFYPEFRLYEEECRFTGCMHLKEPDCGVKRALEAGKISAVRYKNYQVLVEELKDKKKY